MIPEASHLPTLTRAILSTEGPIIEFGMGLFSTSIIALLRKDRDVYHYDTNDEWIRKATRTAYPYGMDHHVHIEKVEEWFNIPIIPAGVLFVDQYPAQERGPSASRFLGHAQMIICHDTEDNDSYGWPLFFKSAELMGFTKSDLDGLYPSTTLIWRDKK